MENRKTLLLVEPVHILQAAITACMARLGWEVTIAVDEKSVLVKALADSFDLILVEISQAPLDGFALIEKIKKQTVINKDTPICTITVHDIPENRERARLLEVDAFFEGVFLNKVAEEIDAYISGSWELAKGEKDEE